MAVTAAMVKELREMTGAKNFRSLRTFVFMEQLNFFKKKKIKNKI